MSGLTFGDVRQWRAGPIEDAAGQVAKRVAELERIGDEVATTESRVWDGDGKYSEERARKRLVRYFEDAANEGRAVQRELHSAADAVTDLKRDVDDADELAGRWKYRIADDGSLVDGELDDVARKDLHYLQDRRRAGAQLRVDIERIMQTAGTIDSDLSAVMRNAAAATVEDPGVDGQDSRLDPPASDDPEAVSDWWRGLTEEERSRLIEDDPRYVGSTDGIPAEDRDRANREVLNRERELLIDRRDELQRTKDDASWWEFGAKDRLQDELDTINGQLNGLDRIADQITDPAGTPDNKRHYLLGLDASTESGQGNAIVSTGNPDTATNTATYVPGTGAGLHNIGGDLQRADVMHREAARAGAKDTAVVTWVDYSAPQSIVTEATKADAADGAKDDLADFQTGLRAAHEGPEPSTNTLVGHSYGSVVVGHTLRDNPDVEVDQAVLVAGPGTGVDHASDLNIGAENVYAVTDDKDPIHYGALFVHGQPPVSEDYGAQVFESDSGASTAVDGAHSKYWDPDNPSREALGRIIAGEDP